MASGTFGTRLVRSPSRTYSWKKNVNCKSDTTFKPLLENYLASVDGCKIHTLEDLIQFNKDHAGQELPPGEYIHITILPYFPDQSP